MMQAEKSIKLEQELIELGKMWQKALDHLKENWSEEKARHCTLIGNLYEEKSKKYNFQRECELIALELEWQAEAKRK